MLKQLDLGQICPVECIFLEKNLYAKIVAHITELRDYLLCDGAVPGTFSDEKASCGFG